MKKLIVLALVALSFTKSYAQKATNLTSDKLENAVIYEVNIRQYSPEGSFNAFTKDIPNLKQLGVKVIDRPLSISGDLEPTVSALKHVLESIDSSVENVVLLQPTNPLRPIDLIKEAFNKFQTEKKDSLFTVSRNYHKLGKIIKDKFNPFNYSIGQRSQDLEPLFFENGLLYITKTKLYSWERKIPTWAYGKYPYTICQSINHPCP